MWCGREATVLCSRYHQNSVHNLLKLTWNCYINYRFFYWKLLYLLQRTSAGYRIMLSLVGSTRELVMLEAALVDRNWYINIQAPWPSDGTTLRCKLQTQGTDRVSWLPQRGWDQLLTEIMHSSCIGSLFHLTPGFTFQINYLHRNPFSGEPNLRHLVTVQMKATC